MTFDWLQFTIAAMAFFGLWAGAVAFLKSTVGTRLRSWWYQQRNRLFQYRLQDRLRAGEDRYFEELRAIEANAPCPPSVHDVAFTDWPKAATVSLLLGVIQAIGVNIS